MRHKITILVSLILFPLVTALMYVHISNSNQLKLEKKVIAWIKNNGGNLRMSYNRKLFWMPKQEPIYYVDLSNPKVTDISPLSKCRYLEELVLDTCSVSDLTPLKNLDRLHHISLDDTTIKSIIELKNCKNLISLSVQNTLITLEQAKELKKYLPKCEIIPFD